MHEASGSIMFPSEEWHSKSSSNPRNTTLASLCLIVYPLRSPEKLLTSSHICTNDPTEAFSLYTNRRCPFARRAHATLKELGLEYEEVFIDLNIPGAFMDTIEREIEPYLASAKPFFGGSDKLTCVVVQLGSFLLFSKTSSAEDAGQLLVKERYERLNALQNYERSLEEEGECVGADWRSNYRALYFVAHGTVHMSLVGTVHIDE
ncbi:hypothetical protein L211DRAFT_850079 [Terfezia boudieri ATCC MYA-4762]|uniref:GST N-terminal domain-containing protein n=1 Tax=Terfezia boudieri ATCC MYA-4762 TaxID=1051890 RepID=A0A3N4LJG1_9PEZI|nr:hypothetical protein L211DRAFT_850079 [Terfezia boudieri ATCC MYA-4762]